MSQKQVTSCLSILGMSLPFPFSIWVYFADSNLYNFHSQIYFSIAEDIFWWYKGRKKRHTRIDRFSIQYKHSSRRHTNRVKCQGTRLAHQGSVFTLYEKIYRNSEVSSQRNELMRYFFPINFKKVCSKVQRIECESPTMK